MDQQRYQRMCRMFLEVRDIPLEGREARLRDLAAGDEELIREVASLLSEDDAERTSGSSDSGFDARLGRLVGEAAAAMLEVASSNDLLSLAPGTWVSRYRIVRPVGSGGFGEVYLAEQERPIRRQVALKVIKPGMDTREVIARFEQERQALAVMDHPSIARIIDAGATESGRPFFVMEYVDGPPLTDYCNAHRLSVERRLDLFVRTCHAVQHAHIKGIIHRDIKPSNILVVERDGVATPIIIDFGVARAISGGLSESTLLQRSGEIVGTPEYMSPEQSGEGVGTVDSRSDVYSLGAVLYELLVGRPPFDGDALRRAGLAEVMRVIREVEPPRPSTALSAADDCSRSIAMDRRTTPAELRATVGRELEWIPLMALRKEPHRRYQSPREMADDVQRYMKGEALAAGPESWTYRSRKRLRQNRGFLSVLALVVGSLVTGLAVALRQTHVANEQRAAAIAAERAAIASAAEERRQRELAESTQDFWIRIIKGAAELHGGERLTVRQALNDAVEVIRNVDVPELARGVQHHALAQAYMALGDIAGADIHAQQAVTMIEAATGPEHTLAASARWDAAICGVQLRGMEEVDALVDSLRAIGRAKGVWEIKDLRRMASLVALLSMAGRRDEAAPWLETLTAERLRLGDTDDSELAGDYYQAKAQHATAADERIALWRRAAEILEARLGVNAPEAMDARRLLAFNLSYNDRYEEAIEQYERVLASCRETYDPPHVRIADTLKELAVAMISINDAARVEPIAEEALAMYDQLGLACDRMRSIDLFQGLHHMYTSLGQKEKATEVRKRYFALKAKCEQG